MAYCFGPSGVLNPKNVFYGAIAVAFGFRLRHRRNKDARTSVPARRSLNDSDFPPAVLERRFGALDFGHLSMEGCRNILLDVSVCDGHDPPKSYLHFEFHTWIFCSLCIIIFLQFYEILSGDRSLPFGRFGGLPNGSNPSKSVGPRVPSDLAGRAVKPVYPIGALSTWYNWGNFDELRLNSPLGAMHEL